MINKINQVLAAWAPWMKIKDQAVLIRIPFITIWVIMGLTGFACIISALIRATAP